MRCGKREGSDNGVPVGCVREARHPGWCKVREYPDEVRPVRVQRRGGPPARPAATAAPVLPPVVSMTAASVIANIAARKALCGLARQILATYEAADRAAENAKAGPEAAHDGH